MFLVPLLLLAAGGPLAPAFAQVTPTLTGPGPARNQPKAPATVSPAFGSDRFMSGAPATPGSGKVLSPPRGGRMQNGMEGTTTSPATPLGGFRVVEPGDGGGGGGGGGGGTFIFLASLSPTSGPVGTSVTLTGTGFTGATGVSFNGTAAGTFAVTSATTATATVPAGATTGNVTITTPGGTSGGVAFTVTVPPLAITSRAPVRNLRNAAAAAPVAVTFDQPMQNTAATQQAVRVFSQQRGGRLFGTQGGAASVSGNTITFTPTNNFRPGETLLVTTTTAATATAIGGGGTLARGQVHQFTVATGGPGIGNFVAPATNANPAVGAAPFSVALGDVDGDGDLDLLTANFNAATVSVRLNDGTGNFTAPATNPDPAVGAGPLSVAVGDVDGDGDLDLLTANFNAATVSVRLNDGAGNFTAPATNPDPAVGAGPFSVAVGDVDGDGDLDLLTANINGNTVSVRLNDGTGNFTAPATNANPAVGTDPRSVAVGDVDGDGDLDLLTANVGSNTVSVRLNDGTGNFTAPATNANPAVGANPASVAVGDVDGDGDLDLLTANAGSGNVSVRLNDGTGNFTAPATNPDPAVGSGPFSVAVGDVDGDGDLDLLTANFSGNTVSVRLNDGTGNFTAPATNANPAVGSFPYSVAVGDVDGDGDLDLLTANNGANTVSVRLNQAAAPGLTSLSPSSGPAGTSITLTGTNFTGATGVSFNGTAAGAFSVTNATTATATVPAGATNGNVTITAPAGTSNGVAFTVTVPAPLTIVSRAPVPNLRNAAAATSVAVTFSQPMQNTAATQQAVRVFSQQRGGRLFGSQGGAASVSGSTVTFNPATNFRPGETLLVTTTAAATATGGATLARGQVHQFTAATGGPGIGNFVAPATNANPAVGAAPFSVALGDVDGDGDLDLLTANFNAATVSVRLNDGTGNFTAPATNPDPAVGAGPLSVAVGDVDGDGDLDLLTANFNAATVSVRLNDGAGNFTAPATNPDPAVGAGPFSVAVGDVDGDGDLDLLTANINGNTVSVRLNDGTGNFTAPATNANPAVGTDPRSVAVGDVDGDGDLDLLTANVGSNTVSVRLNDGTGNFTAPATNANPAVGANPASVAVGDVDGDGDLDLLTANAGSGNVSVRLNDGTGNFTAPATNPDPAVGSGPFIVAVGDVDGDGDLDLLTANFSGNTVSVRLNDGTGNFTAPATNANPAVGSFPYSVAVGDVDGDGDLDLLTANNGANTVSVRLNQAAAPGLTSLSPSSGPAGTSITLTGTGFTGATGVSFNGTAAGTFLVTSATTATAAVPAGATSGNVTITTPGGTSNGISFTVIPPISITSLSPVRNRRNAAAAAPVAVTFNQPMQNTAATRQAVRVFSQQRGGRLFGTQGGAASVSGNTITFTPTNSFRPGETLLVTTTTAATATNGATLARGQVHQFTAATGGPGRGNFLAPTANPDPAVGTNPFSVAVGDVDGDGDLDLLVANNGAGTVSVRLNDGTGNFTAPATNPEVGVGTLVASVALGDVDGDGDLDLLTANATSSGTVSVRLNDGFGNFTGSSNPAVGSFPLSVALGDVDGDGDLDLLTANSNAATVSVRLNDGFGNFTGGSNPAAGSFPESVTVGDVDGDGDLDLLTANFGGNTVSVRLNDGTGNFTGGSDPAVGNSPQSVAVGDVDGDGDLDLLTANNGAGTVSVRLNDSSGNFSGGSDPAVGATPVSVALGDVDGDGDLDLLTANANAATVSVRLNDGMGNFTAPATNPNPAVGSIPFSVALGDVDGDGDLDFLTANRVSNTVSVRLNQSSAPVLTSLSPTSGIVGTSITLTGTNFTGATGVSFNGTAAITFSVATATTATATVPAGATSGPVTITTPGGTSNGVAFTVCAAPVALARAATVQLDANGNVTITAATVNNGSTANCGFATGGGLSVSPSSFTCANRGANLVTLTVTDVFGNVATATATVTVQDNIPPTITAPAAITTVVDLNQTTATNVALGSPTAADNCSGVTVTNNAPATFPLGATTVTWTAQDAAGNPNTVLATQLVAVTRRPTTLTNQTAATVQYSDQLVLTATLVDQLTGSALAGQLITFQIAGSPVGTGMTNASGVATVTWPATGAPRTLISAASYAGSAGYLASTSSRAFNVTPEDARVTYTGGLFAATANTSSGTAAITLSATVRDISALSPNPSSPDFDPAYDALAGDVRNATVTFLIYDDLLAPPIATLTGTVGLVPGAPGDFRTGTATAAWLPNIGSSDSKQYTIRILVGGFYLRNSATDNAMVTVSRPYNDFVTGGGYVVTTRSAGLKAGAPNARTNFGFNIKYNKSGTNLQGAVNLLVRHQEPDGLHVYQVKGNAMQSLSVQPTSATVGQANFTGKANVQDVTNPLAPVSYGGNYQVQLSMTDNGNPGSTDRIAITVWNPGSTLWFASDWTGTQNAQLTLGGGNLVVRGGAYSSRGSGDSPAGPAAPLAMAEAAPGRARLEVYPNPMSERATIRFQVPTTGSTQLRVYNALGQIVATLFDQQAQAGQAYEVGLAGTGLAEGLYTCRLQLGDQQYTQRVMLIK
ncbi:hypothetical protein GCM10022407_16490 [Hymenobacter antarcticus]|uniref:HYR domain-containing protein n=2 Tax=Hymenobacter antarcticus TaxID=486270 RepID=A0ABP7PU70_9BACT